MTGLHKKAQGTGRMGDTETLKEAGQNVLHCWCGFLYLCVCDGRNIRLCSSATAHLCEHSVVQAVNEKRRRLCMCLCRHVHAHPLMKSLMHPLASCSEAFGASAGTEMDAANFSISECVREWEKESDTEETEGREKKRG